ncbi:MAG: glycerol-3-phosphate acyltransferase [Anaerolineales bacterium]|nr:glycerol-3-phosphate acyltransferase [Anaerolineales bacterium]
MQILVDAGIVLASYVFGSVPFGLIVVKLLTGKDIRMVESGRTGGTNALRAAGWVAGLLTGILDILKATATVWLAQAITANEWMHVLAPIAAILGHNYSLFMAERDERGRWRLRGGAGGAASFGGALGLWAPSALIILPIAALIYYFVGYASVTTLSVALMATLIFAVRAIFFQSPWEYVIYGVLSEILLAWALLPNIKRLMDGTERLHGWRAKRQPKEQVNGSDRG